MRNKFFFIILTTLVLGALGIKSIESYFFQNQRLELIDTQITRSAEMLLQARDFREAVRQNRGVEEAISTVLGGERIGKVFLVRDERGALLYQSTNMSVLSIELPTSPDWVALQTDEQYIRIFNAKLGPTRALQVGLVLDRNFVNWSIVNTETVLFASALILGLFVVAVLLTVVLLSPIRFLASHLSRATSDLTNLKDVDPLPSRLLKFTRGFWSKSDEFAILVSTVDRLIGRINQNYKLTRSWTFQMAHELKTPLAIIRAETEAERKAGRIPNDYSTHLLQQVDWTSDTITQFLTWAELENSKPQSTSHVFRAGAIVKDVTRRLEPICKQKLVIRIEEDFSVAASPGHFDQLVTNVVSNSCKFSPEGSTIEITLRKNEMTISDEGPGIPDEVLERFGEPFNLGSVPSAQKLKGTGLGLAWVKTVSKIYSWTVAIGSSPKGTKFTIRFPGIL